METPGFKRPTRPNCMPNSAGGAACAPAASVRWAWAITGANPTGTQNVRPRPDLQSKELTRRYPDHRHGHILQNDLLAQNLRIQIKAALPEGPTHHGHCRVRTAHAVVLGSNQAADCGLHPQYRKEVSNYVFAINCLATQAFAPQIEPGRTEANKAGEDVIVITKMLVAPPGVSVHTRFPRILVQQLYEALGIPDGKKAKHEGVDQAEDARIGADSQR